MMGVRIWEAMVLLTWVYGLWLCLRHTRRAFVLGAYIGTTITIGYDWIFARDWMWRMTFHPDTIWMFDWFGQKYALWAPLSYGFFFGIATFVSLKYRDALDLRLGAWQYLLAFPLIFVLNMIVEGGAIELWQVNIYHLPPQYLVANIPWTHLLTTGTMFSGTLFLTHRAQDVLRYAGWDDFAVGTAPPQPGLRSSILILGMAVPQLAFYVAMVLGFFLYDALGLPTSVVDNCLISR